MWGNVGAQGAVVCPPAASRRRKPYFPSSAPTPAVPTQAPPPGQPALSLLLWVLPDEVRPRESFFLLAKARNAATADASATDAEVTITL